MTKKAEGNPWGMTEREVEIMRGIIRHGSYKVAADRLNISTKTLEAHCNTIRERMKSRGRLDFILRFHEFEVRASMAAERGANDRI